MARSSLTSKGRGRTKSVDGDVTSLNFAAPRVTLGDVVADRVREAILSGDLRPGQHLREEEISEMLDVSRGPVRDGFLLLQREGLVQVLRHRGARVVELSATDLGEVYSLRAAIEDLAVRLAIRRHEDADLAALEASMADMRAGLRRRISEQDAARLDVEFHDAIFAAAHHDRLYESWLAIRMQVFLLLLRRNVANADWRVSTIAGHAEILDLIKASNEEEAAKAVRYHVSTGYRRIVAGILAQADGTTGGKPAAIDVTEADKIRGIAESFLLP